MVEAEDLTARPASPFTRTAAPRASPGAHARAAAYPGVMERPSPQGRPEPVDPALPPRPGRAFLLYSSLRLLLLLVSYAVLLAIGLDGLLAVGVAVLMSALLSLVLLRGQRDAFTAASVARADQRRSQRADRRARLDADGADAPEAGIGDGDIGHRDIGDGDADLGGLDRGR